MTDDFQSCVAPWMQACFGSEISANRVERNDRFIEEALELIQACGGDRERAHALVDYVFDRPVGEPAQEAGGVLVTLAALCLANNLEMEQAGWRELSRIWTKVDVIRAKQAAKPTGSALPVAGAHHEPVEIGYTNWRGEYAVRRIIPLRPWFGSTEWHPTPQWMLKAIDVEKGERDFAIADIGVKEIGNG